MLRAASVIGREFSAPLVAAMLEMPVLDCLRYVDEAVGAGLLDSGPAPHDHRFTHALVRDAIEAGLGAAERTRLHREAAQVLERQCGMDPGPILFELARHWAAAAVDGERARAAEWAESAAWEAVRGLAHEEAARLFQLALSVARGELGQDGEARLGLGMARARYLSGDLTGCVDACLAAAELARRMGRPDLLADAALVPEAIGPTNTEAVTQRLCREALAGIDPDDVPRLARVTARYAEACIFVGWLKEHGLEEYEAAAAASERALELAQLRARATSGMRMNRPRTPRAPVLPDLTGPPIQASPWHWSRADPEPSGRLTLPPVARRALVGDADGAAAVAGVVSGDTLVLRTDVAIGCVMTVDARGRIYVPQWLRRHPGFLVGTHVEGNAAAVVVVPATLFDAIGDRLLERVR